MDVAFDLFDNINHHSLRVPVSITCDSKRPPVLLGGMIELMGGANAIPTRRPELITTPGVDLCWLVLVS